MTRAVAARPARSSRPSSARSSSPRFSVHGKLLTYLKQSERPLESLVFLLPLIAIHEIGWRLSHTRLLAFDLLHRFFSVLGATRTFIPAMALVGILLAWHIATRQKWIVQLNTILWMYLESVLLALPLLTLAAAMARWQPGPLLGAADGGMPDRVVIAMGAGIYEEMIFRLIALTLMSILFVDILGMKKMRAAVLMVVISGLMFSFYHYLGAERFVWKTCLFRTVAGIYFGAVFMCRGFGVTAGSHAAYDVIVCAAAGLG